MNIFGCLTGFSADVELGQYRNWQHGWTKGRQELPVSVQMLARSCMAMDLPGTNLLMALVDPKLRCIANLP